MDFLDRLKKGLEANRRPEDGMLHPSGDLLGPLRHVQLRLAGAPQNENPLVSAIRLMTGTLWHDYIGEMLERQGVPVMREVSVTTGLPYGWSGTADLLTWDKDMQAYVLHDLKTTKGEAIRWIEKDGMKEDHLYQCSAYFWALVEMGFPMAPYFNVIYLPMNDTGDGVMPSVQVGEPVDMETLWDLMEGRSKAVQTYLEEQQFARILDPNFYLTDNLAPPMPREQKLFKEKDGSYTLKLVPNWKAKYCPFDPPLCDCSTQGTTKIGVWVDHPYFDESGSEWVYLPRKGYELTEPLLHP